MAVLCLLCMPCFAQTSQPASISSPAAVLMHPSGEVLYEKNARTQREIASVTKVMTQLLVFEEIEAGRLSMADTVTASAHAASMGGSQIWLEEGERFTVEEMLRAVAIASANDCAVALAEHIAGSEEAFVARMNERARELGMENTVFRNACGLDAEGHLSCAYDVALMGAQLARHQKALELASTRQSYLRDGKSVLDNTNKMIGHFEGMTGLKTGYTQKAGYCLCASAERDGTELIAVVLGGETSQKRNADIAELLNWGFANYVTVRPTTDRPLMPVEVVLGQSGAVEVELAPFEGVLARKGEEVKKTYDYANLMLATTVSMKKLVVTDIYTTDNEDSSSNGAMTLTCRVGDITVDVRTIVLKDADGNIITADYFEGKTIDVRGVVDRFNGTYQIKVFSLSDITIK